MGSDECGQPLLPRQGADAVRRLWLTVAAALFAAALGCAAGIRFVWKGGVRAPGSPVRQKAYSVPVAEGVRYRDLQHLGFDRFAFKSCRVEKRRSGAITFGAFNVLVVEGLTVNVPAAPEIKALPEKGGAEGFAEQFLLSQGFAAGRFSGLRVDGLTVNRCASNRVERVFTAALAESGFGKNEGLKLRECVVSAPDGSATPVREARLVMEPEPALVYLLGGAERRLAIW